MWSMLKTNNVTLQYTHYITYIDGVNLRNKTSCEAIKKVMLFFNDWQNQCYIRFWTAPARCTCVYKIFYKQSLLFSGTTLVVCHEMFNSLYRIDVILFNLHLPLNLLWTLKYFCYKPLLFSLVRIVSWLSWISLVYSIPDDVSAFCLVRETTYTLVTYIQNISAVAWSDCRMVTCEHMRQCFRYVMSTYGVATEVSLCRCKWVVIY